MEYNDIVLYIDPYLSNSVAEKEDPTCKRLLPIPILPEKINDANYVLITHGHRDHCDEDTLVPLAVASPNSKIICPESIVEFINNMGISEDRICAMSNKPMQIAENIMIYPVPAAHPDITSTRNGGWACVGYVIDFDGKRIYHAGDTSIADELVQCLNAIGKIDVALLPVNERNYYREKQGIIGNMSVRDAFKLAEDIQADVMVPTHWDMFAANQVYHEEIELLYKKIKPKFKLILNPTNF
jgi:L-ascorbate metabolism protein UlaG (beta-lactamase superfamily)